MMSTSRIAALSRRELLHQMAVWSTGLAAATTVSLSELPLADAQGPKRGGILRFGLPNEPLTLSGMMTGGDQGFGIVEMAIYDPLCEIDYTTNTAMPGLAESWTRTDGGKTWIVKLRPGVQWHKNFGEVTAEDAVFHINTILQQKMTGIFAWSSATGATKIDKYTFAIHLSQPYQALPLTSLGPAGGGVICKKAFEQMGRAQFERNPIGTGPFEFAEWRRGSQITVRRFKDYWRKGLPYLDQITFKIINDNFVRENLLRNGDVELIFTLEYKDVAGLEKTPDIKVYSVAGQTFDFMAFNPRDPLLNDERIRQAVSYAINRNAIVSQVYYGQAVPTNLPGPKSFLGYVDKPWYPGGGDMTKAKQLLTAAGHSTGVSFPVIVSDKLQLRRELELIQGQLAEANIQIDIQGLDLGTFNTRFFGPDATKKNFRAALRDIAIVSPDTDSCVYWFHHSGTTGWVGDHPDQDKLDRLLDDARAESDRQKRVSLYQQVWDLIMPEAWYIYTVHANYVSAGRTRVHNWAQLPTAAGKYTTLWVE